MEFLAHSVHFAALAATGMNGQQIAELLAIGAAAGVVGGLMGVGGGLVMIPLMYLALGERYGPNSLHVYTLASISTSFVLAVPAARRHAFAHAIHRPMVRCCLPASIAGVLMGVVIAAAFTGQATSILRRVFGLFLILVAAFNAWQSAKRKPGGGLHPRACPLPQRRPWSVGALIGLPSGVIAGLLGVAGGVWAVPAQHMILGVELRNAIANSTAMIVVISLTAAAAKGTAVSRLPDLSPLSAWLLTLILAPGAMIGGWIGAGLTHRLSVRWLRVAIDVVLVISGLRLLA